MLFIGSARQLFADGGLWSVEENVGDESAEGGSQDRGYPEEPELSDRPATDEDRGTSGTGWVNRGIGDRDADEVDQGKTEPDGDGREAFGAR